MSNTLLTIDMIMREAIDLFVNTNAFIQNLNRQYDDQYAQSGAKIGDTLRIRLPNDYVVRDGPNMVMQDTTEQFTTLTLQFQKGVDVGFGMVERTLELDDFSERILAPMMNNLAGGVASTVMGLTEPQAANIVANFDGAGNIITPTHQTWLLAGAILTKQSMPEGYERKLMTDPITNALVSASLAGLFHNDRKIAELYDNGLMQGFALGWQWYNDQTTLIHTTGDFTAGTVNGANQTGQTITVNAITGGLNAGDIITFDDVNAVNFVNKQTYGEARQFVVTADAASGTTSISIYPAIVPPDGSGNPVQYQTVTQSPANGAAINLFNTPEEAYRRNFGYGKDAITLGSADLVIPTQGVEDSAREVIDGVSMSYVSQFVIGSGVLASRLDTLFGVRVIRPEWICVVPDAI